MFARDAKGMGEGELFVNRKHSIPVELHIGSGVSWLADDVGPWRFTEQSAYVRKETFPAPSAPDQNVDTSSNVSSIFKTGPPLFI